MATTKNPGKSLTQRQRKLIKLISDNIGNPEGTKTMYELFLLAGYEESTAKQQAGILNGIKDELSSVVQDMVAHRADVINEMRKKLPKAKYRDLTDSLDKLTKNIQLLSGGKTSNEQVQFTWQK